MPPITKPAIPRSLECVLFLIGCLWLVAARLAAETAARGLANRLSLPILESPLEQGFFLFLLLVGFAALAWTATRSGGIRATNALPKRATSREEWFRGVALGWGMMLIVVLPMMLVGDLQPQLSLRPSSWPPAVISLITLLFTAFALEVCFHGFLLTRLIAAFNPTTAIILVSLMSAVAASARFTTWITIAVAFFLNLLLCIAYLRTHALWLGWGLRFAWYATTGVLLGLPVAGDTAHAVLVSTDVSGRVWFTGGNYGPEASILSLFVILAAIPMLYRITRDYAWNYTHTALVSAGVAVVIAPPKAHTEMEEAAAARPAPLVQILSTTSSQSSTMPAIQEHLRRDIES